MSCGSVFSEFTRVVHTCVASKASDWASFTEDASVYVNTLVTPPFMILLAGMMSTALLLYDLRVHPEQSADVSESSPKKNAARRDGATTRKRRRMSETQTDSEDW